MIKRIHVNQHIIKSNLKNDQCEPVITIKMDGRNIRANEVTILGPSVLKYTPQKPLQCGAKVYLETTSEITYK